MTSTLPTTNTRHGRRLSGESPIGVLDSGLGGLSIVRALQASMPDERILYYADSANCPYGSQNEAFIRDRTLTIAAELEQRGAKALVIACNTACAAALELVRQQTRLPVIGLEPAVKPAVAMSLTGRIGVFATPRTIASERLARLVERYCGQCHVELVPAPDWVDIVERGEIASRRAQDAIATMVQPVVQRGADVLVLGCTHYPFLGAPIKAAAGPGVSVVYSGAAIARRTRHILKESDMLAGRAGDGPRFSLLTSSPDASPVARQAAQMLRMPLL